MQNNCDVLMYDSYKLFSIYYGKYNPQTCCSIFSLLIYIHSFIYICNIQHVKGNLFENLFFNARLNLLRVNRKTLLTTLFICLQISTLQHFHKKYLETIQWTKSQALWGAKSQLKQILISNSYFLTTYVLRVHYNFQYYFPVKTLDFLQFSSY